MNKLLITGITSITTFSVMPPLNFAWLPEWNSYGRRAATTRTRRGVMSRFLVIVVILVMKGLKLRERSNTCTMRTPSVEPSPESCFSNSPPVRPFDWPEPGSQKGQRFVCDR